MITFALDRTTGIRTARFEGRVTDADLLAAYRTLLADPGYDSAADDLVDLRPVERLEASAAALRTLLDLFSPVDRPDHPARLAIVAGSNVTYGMGRMYEIQRDGSPEQVAVFRSHDDALRWLGRVPAVAASAAAGVL